jgi:hypothetical protein
MDVKVEFVNLEEVQMKIALMTNSEARRTFRAGVAEGAKVVKKYAQSGAPGPGIGYKSLRGGPEYGTALVGPYAKNWWYDFFEWGTKEHGPKKKGRRAMVLKKTGNGIFAKRVRGITAKPFMRRALESHVGEVYNAIVSGYEKMIKKLGV